MSHCGQCGSQEYATEIGVTWGNGDYTIYLTCKACGHKGFRRCSLKEGQGHSGLVRDTDLKRDEKELK